MANEKNLISLADRPERERKEIQRKGAEATNRKRRERKTLKEELLLLLSEGNTQKNATVALLDRVLKGDIRAFEVLRDTIGEKQTEKQEITADATISIKLDKQSEYWGK